MEEMDSFLNGGNGKGQGFHLETFSNRFVVIRSGQKKGVLAVKTEKERPSPKYHTDEVFATDLESF